jgi:dsRNA-specific ribonuclease
MSEQSGKGAAEQVVKEAWIGDAVLCLYARERILRESGALDGAKCVRMTSNQFLSAVGEPTKVEAAIGRVYEQHGLGAAFAWIEEKLMPIFARQEENREKKLPGRKRSARMKS